MADMEAKQREESRPASAQPIDPRRACFLSREAHWQQANPGGPASRLAARDCIQDENGVWRWEREEARRNAAKLAAQKAEAEESSAAEEQRRLEEEQAAQKSLELERMIAKAKDRKFRSAVGYGKTRWGMTLAEVRRSEPGGKMINGKYVTPRKIGQLDVVVAFWLVADRLSAVAILAPGRFDVLKSTEDFNGLLDLMREKYGQETEGNADAGWDAFDFLTHLSTGEIELAARWSFVEEEIILLCQRESPGARTQLLYVGREMLPLLVESLGRERQEMLDGL